MKLTWALIFVVCFTGAPVFGQVADTSQTAPTVPNLPDVNRRLLELVIQDQWDRGIDMFSGMSVKTPTGLDVSKRDAERRTEVRKMLAEGTVNSGREYYFSALIFQHSLVPEDLMLAHVLAVSAVTRGHHSAKWMAAATLDRYLWATKRPQIFGTQFQKGVDEKWTMEPYNRVAVSDSVRGSWCVVPLEEQEKVLRDFQIRGPLTSTQVTNCQ